MMRLPCARMFRERESMRADCCCSRSPGRARRADCKHAHVASPTRRWLQKSICCYVAITLSSAPYAEANRPQQNTQSSRETIQDHCARQGFASAILSPPFALGEECETPRSSAHNSNANDFMRAMQPEARACQPAAHLRFSKLDCTMSILREFFFSVRGYGWRTYEPRQGRNAATVV